MTPSNAQSPVADSQKEFFDDSSFKTLYGGVVVTWVATSAIADVFGEAVDIKILGFTVAIIVALVGFFLSEQRNLKKLVVAPFNGLLIYLTIMGGTSFLPADLEERNFAANDTSKQEMVEDGTTQTEGRSAFLKAWNPNHNLLETATELKVENQQLEDRTEELSEINRVYELRLDSTRQVLQTIELSPEVRENLMQNLDVSRNPVLLNSDINQ